MFANRDESGANWLDPSDTNLFVWMKQGGTKTFSLVTTPNAVITQGPTIWPLYCGNPVYSMTHDYSDPTTVVFQTLGTNDHALQIDSNIGLYTPDVTIEIKFTVSNDYGSKPDFTTGKIALRECVNIPFSAYSGAVTQKEFQIGTDSDGSIQWDEFIFSQSFCVVDTYELESCDGPFMDAAGDLTDPANQLQAYGAAGPLTSSICNDAFSYDFSIPTQTITEKFDANSFTNFYEGEYVVKIRGFNSVYNPTLFTDNKQIVTFVFKLKANCDDASTVITGPTTVWSNPIIQSTGGHGPDFTREYKTAPGPTDPDFPMEVYYGVRTNE